MSIIDYLSTLDYDQLQRSIEIAQSMIQKKQQEKKVALWLVTDGSINHAAFREGEYEKAVDAAAKVVAKDEWIVYGKDYFKIEIRKVHVMESEISELLELSERA